MSTSFFFKFTALRIREKHYISVIFQKLIIILGIWPVRNGTGFAQGTSQYVY